MIAKTFRAYSANFLRQDKIFRDHGSVAVIGLHKSRISDFFDPGGSLMILPGIFDGRKAKHGALYACKSSKIIAAPSLK